MKIQLFVVIALTFSGACPAYAAPEPTLNACDNKGPERVGWKPLSERYKSIWVSFLLPPAFAPVDSKFRHGGWKWKSGNMEIYEGYGHWGATSFGGPNKSTDTYSECESEIDGHKVLLVTKMWNGEYEALAWFKDLATAPLNISPILGGKGKGREDQRLLLKIVRTAKVIQKDKIRSNPSLDRPAAR